MVASVGVKQVEFAGLGQNAANPGGTAPNLGSVANPANLYANRAAYRDYIRTLRGLTAKTADEEPKWRKKGSELLTGYKQTW